MARKKDALGARKETIHFRVSEHKEGTKTPNPEKVDPYHWNTNTYDFAGLSRWIN